MRTVRAQHDVVTPAEELERQRIALGPLAEDRDCLAAPLPAVAIGAVERADAIGRLEPIDLRNLVLDPEARSSFRARTLVPSAVVTTKYPSSGTASSTMASRTMTVS